jgi:hypothetical protein
MAHIAGGVASIIFWGMALYVPGLFWVWGGRGLFSPSETIYAMRLPVFLLLVFGIAQSWLSHSRFAADEWVRALRTTVVVSGVVLALVLLRGGHLLIAGPRWVATQANSLATLNQMLAGTLVLACVLAVLVCAHEVRRLVRRVGGGRHQRSV